MAHTVTQIEFDTTRASRFRPRDRFVKTAILLVPAGPGPVTIRAPFADQQMHGPFYVVAGPDGSYGATRDEFEQSHRQVGPQQWLKVQPVLAYRATEPGTVVTSIGGQEESRVDARPGDWIVQQSSGEVMALTPSAFDLRYEPEPAD